MHLVKMPQGGLYRAGRWGDVDTYPGPAPMISLRQPREDGFRWEDALGGFATAKCSASEEAAIGRTIARYRPARDRDGTGIIRAIKNFMSGPPDDAEPELVDGVVPAGVFDDLYSIHIPGDRPVEFVDLGHEDTLRALETQLDGALQALGIGKLSNNLAREKDRRVTRLAMRALYSLSVDGGYGPVAGIRCPGQPDPAWEAFVLWSPPSLVGLTGDDVEFRWIARWDEDVIAAARTLGLQLPDEGRPPSHA